MKRIAITIGDPAGIGSEIILKTLEDKEFTKKYPFTVIAPKFIIEGAIFPHDVEPFAIEYGKHSAKCGEIAMQAIRYAVENFDAIVTAPINKHSIALAGYNFAGHTEYLAELTGSKNVSMMLVSDTVRVIVVTTHLPLKDVSANITHERVLLAIRNAHMAGKMYGIKTPRIAVCGLNPHAGDNGTLGTEEREIINPAIQQAIQEGINATGAHSADALYAHPTDFDVSVAMYHDQGLIPVKMGGSASVVNITLGLPIVRTSVGHGTAFDIAGKGIADNTSLKNAIIEAHRMMANV